jgi:kynurenine 3-monooxygenase
MASENPQKTLVIGAGPVGALAALYAANRGDEVEVYELRGGKINNHSSFSIISNRNVNLVSLHLTSIRSTRCLHGSS